ncbi:MAG: hypothetical protein NDJ90_08495 [Oligoflexia bacterium]|nr:hypothetical protein [Oligoflexia bacterium]
MRSNFNLLVSTLLLTVVVGAFLGEQAAADDASCEERVLTSGNVKAYSMPMDEVSCMVSVSPVLSRMTFRQFMFRSDGLFSVFVSTEGPEETSTGTRGYFLFPRGLGRLKVETNVKATLRVKLPSSSIVSFSSANARVTGFSGARYVEDPEISLRNYGGFEFISFDGLLLDTGWHIGSTAYSKQERESLFRDSENNYCVVKNTDIFNYGELVTVKFETDAELAAFLVVQCPTLKLDALWASPKAE